jgi:hypothetical protein
MPEQDFLLQLRETCPDHVEQDLILPLVLGDLGLERDDVIDGRIVVCATSWSRCVLYPTELQVFSAEGIAS